jgi:hypothetical protein
VTKSYVIGHDNSNGKLISLHRVATFEEALDLLRAISQANPLAKIYNIDNCELTTSPHRFDGLTDSQRMRL